MFRSIKVADNVVFIYKCKIYVEYVCSLSLSFLDHHFCENAEFGASFHHVKMHFSSPCPFLSGCICWHVHTCALIYMCTVTVAVLLAYVYTIQLLRSRVCSYVHVHCHTSYSDRVYDPAPTGAVLSHPHRGCLPAIWNAKVHYMVWQIIK